MPDANGNFKGQGWSRARAAGWERVFGPRADSAKFDPAPATMAQPLPTPLKES